MVLISSTVVNKIYNFYKVENLPGSEFMVGSVLKIPTLV